MLPPTGTIGAASTQVEVGRRTLPEPVVVFNLETVTRDRERGENGLALVQSLRQSRLTYLTSMLPFFSTRHRTATKYHPPPAGFPYPHDLDPSSSSSSSKPHTLVNLGKADVEIGPFFFPKTRFSEARVELPPPPSAPAPHSSSSAPLPPPTSTSTPTNTNTTTATKPLAPSNPGAIDDALVLAVSSRAQRDPPLQRLLHVAANGRASQEELRELAGVIAKIGEEMKRQPSTSSSNAQSNRPSAPPTPAPTPTPAPAPAAPTSNPLPRPPIITVEFRENPSARFILPLWRGAVVERKRKGGKEGKIKVTMWMPAIGSTAGNAAAAERTSGTFAGSKSSEIAADERLSEITAAGEKSSGTAGGGKITSTEKKQDRAAIPPGCERFAVTLLISLNEHDNVLWEAFGRMPGVQTVEGDRIVERGDEKLVAEFIERLKRTKDITSRLPSLFSPPKDLADHLSDRFAPRMHVQSAKPNVKLRRNEPDEVEVMVVKQQQGTKRHHPPLQLDDTLPDHQQSKPKRKRHVAKQNPDGTPKLCQACQTNDTPMWRRGPSGKSTLCNACGAKWKVGRLVMPQHQPEQRQESTGDGTTASVSSHVTDQNSMGQIDNHADSHASIDSNKYTVTTTQQPPVQ